MLLNVNFANTDHQLIPGYQLDIFEIHILRIVPNSLYFERIEGKSGQSGLLCIDQARHLYMVKENDTNLSTFPVIGL